MDTPGIIDVEASGFGVHSYPIEVGLALPDQERFCILIKPIDSWKYWDDKAEEVHHISRDILCKHGRSVREVALLLNERLEQKTVYSDGWVVDYPWLLSLYHTAGLSMSFHISPLEMILSEAQMEIWHETKDRLLEELSIQRHRASHDAWLIQKTFQQTLIQSRQAIA